MAVTVASSLTTATSGTTTANRFGPHAEIPLNTLNDPTGTISARQPAYYDVMSGLYARYKVHGVKIKVTFQNNYDQPISVGMMFSPPGATTGGLSSIDIQQAYGVPLVSQIPLSGSAGQSVVTVDSDIDIAALCGLSKEELNADVSLYSALTNANPTRIPYLYLAVANVVSSGTNVLAYVMSLEYDVEFFDRKYNFTNVG